MSTEAWKPPPDDEKPKPPPPPDVWSPDTAFFAPPTAVAMIAGPYRVVFDKSEPPPGDPRHTGAPQMRLVQVLHKSNSLIWGMSGFLAAHEVAPDVYQWLGGSHGGERAGHWSYSADGPALVAVAQSWLGQGAAPLAEREVEYRASYYNGVLALRVTTATRVMRPHRIASTYDFMLPLVRYSFTSWRADTLEPEPIPRVVRDPTNKLTDSAITVRAQGVDEIGGPSLWYQGHKGAPIYARMRPYDEQCKLYHRSRWQDPVMLEAGQELRSNVSLFIGEHC